MTFTLAGPLMSDDGQAVHDDDLGLVDAHAVDVDDLIIGEDRLPVDLDLTVLTERHRQPGA